MPATSRDHAGSLPECRGDCGHGAPGSRTSPGAGRFSPVPGVPDRTALIRSGGHGLAGTGTGLAGTGPSSAGTGPRLAGTGSGPAGTGVALVGTGSGLAGPAPPPDVAEHDVIAANCDSRSPDAGMRLQASNNPLPINTLRPIGDRAGAFRGRPSPNPSHFATSAEVPAFALPMCIEFHWKQCVTQCSVLLAHALQTMAPSNCRPHPSGWTGGTDGQTRADGTRVEPNDAFLAPEPAFSHASCEGDGSGTGRRAGPRRGEEACAAGRAAARRAMRHGAPGGFGSRHSCTAGTRGALAAPAGTASAGPRRPRPAPLRPGTAGPHGVRRAPARPERSGGSRSRHSCTTGTRGTPGSPAGTASAGPRRLRPAPLRPDSGGTGGRRTAGGRRGLRRARAAQATGRPGAGTDFKHGHGRQPTPWAVPTHRGLGPHPGHRPTS